MEFIYGEFEIDNLAARVDGMDTEPRDGDGLILLFLWR
jgi:hypothetical protein